jgi:hypothetical protein
LAQIVIKTFLGEPLMAPKVNISGTSRSELVRQYSAAQVGIMQAIKAVREAAPHMRDFQTYEDTSEAYRTALRQHMARVSALESMDNEFNSLAHAVMKGK